MTPPAKKEDIREEETVVACDLAGDLATVSTAMKEPKVPEMPVTLMSSAILIQK